MKKLILILAMAAMVISIFTVFGSASEIIEEDLYVDEYYEYTRGDEDFIAIADCYDELHVVSTTNECALEMSIYYKNVAADDGIESLGFSGYSYTFQGEVEFIIKEDPTFTSWDESFADPNYTYTVRFFIRRFKSLQTVYNEAYAIGEMHGSEATYNEAYTAGEDEGRRYGYDEGFAVGRSQGYNAGYLKGKNDQIEANGETNAENLYPDNSEPTATDKDLSDPKETNIFIVVAVTLGAVAILIFAVHIFKRNKYRR